MYLEPTSVCANLRDTGRHSAASENQGRENMDKNSKPNKPKAKKDDAAKTSPDKAQKK